MVDGDRRKEDVETKTHLAVLANDVDYIKIAVVRIETKIEDKYVTKDEFKPVRLLVYGFAALVLSGVIVALIKLAVK
jgi:hypothetical protein